MAFEEEIERLSREKAALEANILRFKQQRSTELEELTQWVHSVDQRQDNLLSFLQKAIQNPTFVEHLARKVKYMDASAYNKKRRKPLVDQSKPVVESNLLDSNSSCSRPEFGNIFHRDLSNKSRLELSPSVSDVNLVSHSTQSSNEDGGSPQKKISEVDPKDAHARTEGNLYVPETFEVSDSRTSFTFKMDSSFSQKVANDSTRVHSLQQRLTSTKEVDGHVSCHLNLTLSSSHLQVDNGFHSSRMPIPSNEPAKATELSYSPNDKESSNPRLLPNNRNLGNEDVSLSSSQETTNNNPGPAAAPARVNDVFWEQFLTERPGSSDNEEASSSYRANPYEEQEDRSSQRTRNATNMEQLTL